MIVDVTVILADQVSTADLGEEPGVRTGDGCQSHFENLTSLFILLHVNAEKDRVVHTDAPHPGQVLEVAQMQMCLGQHSSLIVGEGAAWKG